MLESCESAVEDETRRRMKRLRNYSGLLRQVIDNLNAEINLPCAFWRGFVDALNTAASNVDELCMAIRTYAQSALFRGPVARVPAGTMMGRATSRRDLAKHFRRSQYMPDDLAASLAIEDAMVTPIEVLRKKWEGYSLGRYVMWATFDPAGNRPFAIPDVTARLLRGRLGLPGRRSRYPVLSLEYELPAHCPAHLPTIAEACAGKPWLVFFRPSGKEDLDSGFSLTQPHDDIAGKHAGMPEVVHAPVTGAALAHPPAEID